MNIVFDGLSLENISSEEEAIIPRISSVVLLSGDTYIQTEGGKFGASMSYSGVSDDWVGIVLITGKIGVKGALVTPTQTFNNCSISSLSSSKIKGAGSKYKYQISFVKEGGTL